METGDVVWNTHMDGSNATLYRVGKITLQSDGKPFIELLDFYTGKSIGGTEYVQNLHVAKRLPEHLCYEPFKGK